MLTKASAIPIKPVHWFWEGRIPCGALSLIAGREGIGKSILGYQLVANVTQGTLEGRFLGKPKSVIVCATEDSWHHTVVPRLMAAGADLDRVHRLDAVTETGLWGSLSLPRDTRQLEALIRENDVALVLLDPLMSRLDRTLDTHKDAEVRQALEPVTAIADRTGAAFIGLIHCNKGRGTDALDRIMGSKAFTAVARSVNFMILDPDDASMRLLGTPKNNLGRTDLPTLTFTIEGLMVAQTDGEEIWTGKLVWQGDRDMTIDEALESSDAGEETRSTVAEAMGWLDDYLTVHGGEAASAEIKKSGQKEGHSADALKRARRRLKAGVRQVGFPRTTIWFLPGALAPSQVDGGSISLESEPLAPTAPTVEPDRQLEQLEQSEFSPE
jgi:hypothetical protein